MNGDLHLRCNVMRDDHGDAVISVTATLADADTAGAVILLSAANLDVSRERPRRTTAPLSSRDLRARQLLHARRP